MDTQNILFLIFAFIVSFVFTFATTPLVRRLAFKIGAGAVDIPKDARRMHKKPTPRIGGIAIVFGFTVAALCFGSAMIEYALSLAKKMGYEQAELEVVDGNNRAKSLYERFGFKETGKNFRALKYDDGSYKDEYKMVKIL